jgi:hypothetical protein
MSQGLAYYYFILSGDDKILSNKVIFTLFNREAV